MRHTPVLPRLRPKLTIPTLLMLRCSPIRVVFRLALSDSRMRFAYPGYAATRPSPLPLSQRERGKGHTPSACSCTPATARPEGSAIFAKLASQAIAAGEEQAIDLPPGTVSAAAGVG